MGVWGRKHATATTPPPAICTSKRAPTPIKPKHKTVALPKSMGGGAPDGGASGSGGRPSVCKITKGPLCCWTRGGKYNT
jgi:hypothetical protein